MSSPTNLKMQSWIALAILAVGLALMAFMIYAESEPGLLPLVLVLSSSIWLFVTRARIRARKAQG